jgi:hypothetical protein
MCDAVTASAKAEDLKSIIFPIGDSFIVVMQWRFFFSPALNHALARPSSLCLFFSAIDRMQTGVPTNWKPL